MRIIYKPYMMRRILNAKRDALAQDKEIEKIKLTPEEWEQLKEEACQHMAPEEWYRRYFTNNRTAPTVVEVYGIVVEKE